MFLSAASAPSTPLALSRPWGIPRAKGCGVVDVTCTPQPWGAASCPGGHLLSMHSYPEPFRSLESSASHGGRNGEEPGGKVMGLCREALVIGSLVQDETLEQEGSTGSFPFWSFLQTSLFSKAEYQTLHRHPACSPPRLQLLSEMFVVRGSWWDQSSKMQNASVPGRGQQVQNHPAVGDPVGKEGFGWTRWCFICGLAVPGNAWLKTERNITGRSGFGECCCCVQSCS